MSINAGVINGAAINSSYGPPIYEEILTSLILGNTSSTDNTIFKDVVLNPISLIVSEITKGTFNNKVSTNANIVSSSKSMYITLDTLNDSIKILSSTLFLYPVSIADSITILNTITSLKELIEKLQSNTLLLSQLSSKTVYTNDINDLLFIIISLEKVIGAEVLDSLGITESIKDVLINYLSVISSSLIVDTPSSYFILSDIFSEIININNEIDTNTVLTNILEDSFLITLPEDFGCGSYLAYLLAPETSSVFNYNNYNFDGSCKFNGKYLLSNSTGIYEYGGTTDNSSKIVSELETVAFNFNTSNLKQVPSIYLGVDSNDVFYLKVRTDGKAEVLYKLNKYTTNLMTQKVDIGKGLLGRYFQFEIVTDSTEFSLESIDFYPIALGRKL